MFRSLRNRLILSHIIPLVVILPIMGFALTYLLETHYILPQVSDDLTGSAALLARLSINQPEIWLSPVYAQAMLENTVPETSAQVMLLTPTGRLLASSLAIDPSLIGTKVNISRLQDIQKGNTVSYVHFSPRSGEEAVDIFTPAIAEGRLIGIVRMTYQAKVFYQEFSQLSALIGVILVFGMIIGVVLGSILAYTINKPIAHATQQIYQVARGELREPQPEYGPDEVRLFLRAMNFLIEQLNNLEQSRKQLLANLVHELGRPLGALRSAIQSLAMGAGHDPQFLEELTHGMDQETLRLQHLVEDLAQLHEQSLGVMELDLTPLELSAWLPSILPPWRQAAAEKRLHWEETIPADIPAIQADTTRMAQVIGNLVSNAIKYTPVGGTVTISAGSDPEGAWIKVTDTGPGISTTEQSKIFNPYYRGQQGRRIVQGMGLGLSIARDLVSAHGGEINVDSTPGLGSTFTVHIPRHEELLPV